MIDGKRTERTPPSHVPVSLGSAHYSAVRKTRAKTYSPGILPPPPPIVAVSYEFGRRGKAKLCRAAGRRELVLEEFGGERESVGVGRWVPVQD